MAKAVLYARFSSTQQAQGDSIQRQLQAALTFCDREGLELASETFEDLGISAWKADKREGLERLLEAIEKGVISNDSFILVEQTDRLSRMGFRHVLGLVEKIVSTGCKFVTLNNSQVFTKDNIDDLQTALYLIISADLAYQESQTKSRRLRSVKTRKRNERVIQGNQPFWIDLVDGKPVLNSKLPIIKRIVQMALDGRGQKYIATVLNKEGIPSPKGKTWEPAVIRAIFKNTILYGAKTYFERRDGKYEDVETVEDLYPAVCSKVDFMKIRIEKKTKPNGNPASGPWANILKCEKCGSHLNIKQRRGDNTYRICAGVLKGTCDYSRYYRNLDSLLLNVFGYINVPASTTNASTELFAKKEELEVMLFEFDELRNQNASKPKILSRIYEDIDRTENELDDINAQITASTITEKAEKVYLPDVPAEKQNALIRRYIKRIDCSKMSSTEIICKVYFVSGKFMEINSVQLRGMEKPAYGVFGMDQENFGLL